MSQKIVHRSRDPVRRNNAGYQPINQSNNHSNPQYNEEAFQNPSDSWEPSKPTINQSNSQPNKHTRSRIAICILLVLCAILGIQTGRWLMGQSMNQSIPRTTGAVERFVQLAKFQDSEEFKRVINEIPTPEQLNMHKVHRTGRSVNHAINPSLKQSVKFTVLDRPSNPNSLPLIPARIVPADQLSYQQDGEDVPPPFALNGPDSAHNEERRQLVDEMEIKVGLPGSIMTICSPGSIICATVGLSSTGDITLSATSLGEPIISQSTSTIAVNYRQCHFTAYQPINPAKPWLKSAVAYVRRYRGSSFWRPVPAAERRYSYSEYESLIVYCKGEGCKPCQAMAEIRLFDEAVAIRHLIDIPASDADSIMNNTLASQKAAGTHMDPQSIIDRNYAQVFHSLDTGLPSGLVAQCWANSQEEAFVKHLCANMPETMTPITVQLFDPPNAITLPQLQQRFVTFLQADGAMFMRSTGTPKVSNERTSIQLVARGEVPIFAKEGGIGVYHIDDEIGLRSGSDWHVALFGTSPGELLERNYIVPLLCPPPNTQLPNMKDTRWIGFGKSLRGRGFDKQDGQVQTEQLIDWVADNNFQLVHFDAGWYGDEYSATSSALAVFEPYRPYIDMKKIGDHAASKGVKFTVYVNELGLRDTHDLARVYSDDWHIHGVKFGFVNTLSPRAMRVLAERVIEFGSKNMFINIHDLYRPKGWTRTWPHLVTQEGIRGEERKPQAEHHTQLMFTRFIQGSADYTPRYLKGSGLLCTRTHQLALPIIFFSPIQSLFWAEPQQAIMDGVRMYYPELVIWKMLPTVWDDTRVMAAEISGFSVVARRTGQEWFIGGITGLDSTTLRLNLSSLFVDLPTHPRSLLPPPAKGYLVHMYADAFSTTNLGAGVLKGRNGVKTLPRVTFILPAEFSSALEVVAPVEGFPQESEAYVEFLKTQATHRRSVWDAFDAQLREDRKHFLQKPESWQIMENGIVEIDMAPSGGTVIYVQPYY